MISAAHAPLRMVFISFYRDELLGEKNLDELAILIKM